MPEPLTPPEVLQPPEPVAAVAPTAVHEMVPLDEQTLAMLQEKVTGFVDAVLTLDVDSEAFKEKVTAVHVMGSEHIRQAASVSNRMLERPAHAMDAGFLDEKSPVSSALVELRRTIEDLDPSRQGDLTSPKKLFGFIPYGSRLRDYFLKYQSSQTHINRIIDALLNGQEELRRDNGEIEQEKANLWGLMGKLRQYSHLGQALDKALEGKVAEIEADSPEKARVVKEEMLFYVRQKVQDLLTQLAVSIQGYLTLDMVRKNNLELIKGVDRATTTTVSALRTAVMLSQALANQKLVLDQITALNETTGNLIESTSAMLKNQSAEIQEQAAGATLDLDKLKSAFGNIYQTMDMMTDYKVKALDSMKTTVSTLSAEVDRAQGYLDRAREDESALPVVGVDSGIPPGDLSL